MRFHWQNLNERDQTTGRRNKLGLEGRAWLGKWRFSWDIPTHFWALELSFNGGDSDDEIQLFVGCGLFAFWLSRERLPIPIGEWHEPMPPHVSARWFWRKPRECGVTIHGGAVRLRLWGNPEEWKRADPWWARGLSWYPVDTLLGRRNHEHRILEEWKEVLVPMPEGCYKTQMRREEREWKRPRWPWWPSRVLQEYVEIQIEGGIPFEGKGENSWDCGEDGLWGCSSSGASYEKAIGHVVESVLTSRKRHGGSWVHRGLEPTVVTREREK